MSLISHMGGLNHFWSTDGVECLWCGSKRTPKEVFDWRKAGSPDELCICATSTGSSSLVAATTEVPKSARKPSLEELDRQ